MTEHRFSPEKLRPASTFKSPIPRNAVIAWPDPVTGVLRPVKVSDLHDAVSAFSLHAGVPEDIVQHFETVKNVYLLLLVHLPLPAGSGASKFWLSRICIAPSATGERDQGGKSQG